MPAQFDVDRWQEIQNQKESRGKSQRGIPRTKDPARYPLSCRIVDLTDGCGSIMYSRTHSNRPIYSCGRYMRTEAAECYNNVVDAEAMLRFTLKSVCQLLNRHGNEEKIRHLLLERARREKPGSTSATDMEIDLMTRRCEELRNDLATVQHRMAREKDDSRYAALADEFDKIRADLATAEKELQVLHTMRPESVSTSPEAEVEAAMGLLKDIGRITSDTAARKDINPLLVKLGVRIGLNFGEAIKGKKRKVRRLQGGIMTFGKGELPVNLHGPNYRGPSNPPTTNDGDIQEHTSALEAPCQPPGKAGESQSEEEAGGRGAMEKAGEDGEPSPPTLSACERPARAGQDHPEGISSTKGNRGDWRSFEPWVKEYVAAFLRPDPKLQSLAALATNRV